MTPIHVPNSTAQLVDRMTALVTQLRSATSVGFTTPEALERAEAAAVEITAKGRELRMHVRQIVAEAKRAQRERRAA